MCSMDIRNKSCNGNEFHQTMFSSLHIITAVASCKTLFKIDLSIYDPQVKKEAIPIWNCC